MKSGNSLQQLILSLSPSEKRYIRIYASRHSTDKTPRYLVLFDYLNDNETSTEADLLATIYQGKSRTAYAAEKQYLYEIILGGMRSYHSDRTLDLSISEAMADASFLFGKQHYEESMDYLNHARSLAQSGERWPALIELLKLECDIIKEKKNKGMLAELKNRQTELEKVLTYQAYDAMLKMRRDLVFAHVRMADQGFDNREEIVFWNTIYNEAAFKSERFNVHYYTLSALGLLFYKDRNYKASVDVYREMLALWQNNSHRIKCDPLLYSKVLSNALNAAIAAGNYSDAEQWLRRYEELETDTPEAEAEKFQNISFVQILLMLHTASFQQLPVLSSEIETGLQKYKSKINKARELAFYYNLAVAYFADNNFSLSLSWINRIVQQEKNEHRLDLQHFARIFRLILFYELGKYDLLEYECLNTERYLRGQKVWGIKERNLIKLIEKLPEFTSTEKSEAFRKFLIENEKTGKLNSFGDQEIEVWINSYLNGFPISQLIKKQI
jgi:hypothetical protein